MIFSLPKFIPFAAMLLFANSIIFAQAPANNNCANAAVIVSDSTCKAGGSMLLSQSLTNPTGQTLFNATYNASQINASPSSTCTFIASQDVWYKFVAKSKYPNISVSNLGSEWGKTGSTPKIQLFSGNCNGFTEIACANNTPITLTPADVGLTVSTPTTYYIRVLKNNTTVPDAGSGSGTGITWGFNICITDQISKVSRMNEIFSRTYLSGAGALNYPWEVTYGPDDSLWITESRGYKVYKMNSTTGGKRVVLDLTNGSTWFANSSIANAAADTLSARQNAATWNGIASGWPQGGLAGLALHPQFGTAGSNYVYITYIWKYISGTNPDGIIYQNKIIRLTYNTANGRLENPDVLDWNLPGSTDHNSQRLIIAPIVKNGTTYYLFMGSGDMGSGQFYNRYRPNNAQNSASAEGKILRYNIESDGDLGYNAWIPNDNPYGATNPVWSIGIRNNQGFAYDTATNIMYGSSHGPYSDDELNIIEKAGNYGHPRVIGYKADGNYNGNSTAGTSTSISAGAPYSDCATAWYIPSGYTPPTGMGYTSPYCGQSSLAPIGNEAANATAIGASYRDPLFSAYPTLSTNITGPPAVTGIADTWRTNPGNGGWESEGWSGLDLYTSTVIPGWKKSLVAAGLKWGRLIKLNLDATGKKTMPSGVGGAAGNISDTITYFQSSNRYRDLAFAPNGKDIFVVMDNSSATSGPGTANPSAAGCPGCVIKYSFLGYADAAGASTIPKSIDVTTTPTKNICYAGTPVTIDATNNSLWVPITGPDGNIMAELNAMGQNMGVVNSSVYINSGAVRVKSGKAYLDRNITITPSVVGPYTTPVKIRLYLLKTEMTNLLAAPSNGLAGDPNNIRILKNDDLCLASVNLTTSMFTQVNTDITHGTNGYVLQTAVTTFSSFYFGANNFVLPVDLITFNGALQSDLSALLKWKTEKEINTSGFDLERSVDGNNFKKITFVKAAGNSNSIFDYAYTDNEAIDQQSITLYYRLKIINSDGSFKYSNSITITLPITKAIITIAPNPVVNDVKGNIISPITANVTLRIFDNTGRLVLQSNTFVRKGNNNFAQNINQLASGAYYLDISGNGIMSRTKFQKL